MAQEAQKPRQKSIFEIPAPQADTLAPFGTWLNGRLNFWSDAEWQAPYNSEQEGEAGAVYNLLEQIQTRFNQGVDLIASHSMTQTMWDYLSEDVHLADVNLGDEKSELEIDGLLSDRLATKEKNDFRVYLENRRVEFSGEKIEDGSEEVPHADAICKELGIVLYEYERRSYELEETVTVVTVTTVRRRYYDGRGVIPATAKTPQALAREYSQKLREESQSFGQGPMDEFASSLEESLKKRYGSNVSVSFVRSNPFEM